MLRVSGARDLGYNELALPEPPRLSTGSPPFR
jgi:hypothetical protein